MPKDNKRGYAHIHEVASEVFKMSKKGKSQREISEHYGFKDKYVVKSFLRRHRHKERLIEAGITPSKEADVQKGLYQTKLNKIMKLNV